MHYGKLLCMLTSTTFCHACGVLLQLRNTRCPSCGYSPAYTGVTRRLAHSPNSFYCWSLQWLCTSLVIVSILRVLYPFIPIIPSALSLLPNLHNPILLQPDATLATACSDPFGTYLMVYHVDQVDWPVVFLHTPPPQMPTHVQAHPEIAIGSVAIDLILAPCGVVDTGIMYSVLKDDVAMAVRAAARQIQFWPATHNGYLVPQTVRMQYDFYPCPGQGMCAHVNEVSWRVWQRRLDVPR